jgi:hypothetical protein
LHYNTIFNGSFSIKSPRLVHLIYTSTHFKLDFKFLEIFVRINSEYTCRQGVSFLYINVGTEEYTTCEQKDERGDSAGSFTENLSARGGQIKYFSDITLYKYSAFICETPKMICMTIFYNGAISNISLIFGSIFPS